MSEKSALKMEHRPFCIAPLALIPLGCRSRSVVLIARVTKMVRTGLLFGTVAGSGILRILVVARSFLLM
jgi:hypothetical protein